MDGEQFEALFTGTKSSKQLIEEVHHMEKAIEEANALEAAQDLEDDEEELEESSDNEGEYLAEEPGSAEAELRDDTPDEEK